MTEETKKISFSFSKSIKKPILKHVVSDESKKVDYIECVDDKSIRIIGGVKNENQPLVIPMLGSKTWHDRILNKIDADIFDAKTIEPNVKNESMESVQIKQENINLANGDISNRNVIQAEVASVIIKKEPDENLSLTINEQAAQEIIADLKLDKSKNKETETFTVPITNDDNLEGKEESTLEDYENIPIDAFGMAMLRGMGWQPGKGIGKNQKVVPPTIPELRPKGMGLGADKLAIEKAKGKGTKEDEQIKLDKGSYIKITAGKHSGNYGKVEGFDEDASRIILKLALRDELISINEFWIKPVSLTEYTENSKILNIKKYEEYKSKETGKKNKIDHDSSKSTENSDDGNRKNKCNEKLKKISKKKRRHSSDDDSSVDRKSRKERDSSSSDEEERKQKRSKKSKKHKKRDSSLERSIRKRKRKDKEREKTKNKKSVYSDKSTKRSHRNHRKSRSRSR